ncbi:MAG: IS4 family transposase [Saprospiraceae bacterium]
MSVIQSEIFSTFLKEKFTKNPKDFSRMRKQTFAGTIIFMINFLTKSLSLEIVNFLSLLKRKNISQESFTKSAFVQGRGKIKPEVFIHLNQKLVEEFYSNNPGVKKGVNGFRILAMDGSRFTLPHTRELARIYGETKNQNYSYVIQAKACVLFDILNNICIGGVFSPIATDERIQAKQLLDNCHKGDLVIYDRGFPSFDFMYEHYQRGLEFLIRVRVDFNQVVKDFVQGGKLSQIVEMQPGKNSDLKGKPYDKNASIKVRLLKIVLPDGEIEILVTSLMDSKQYGQEIFKELYFKRWKIETYYDELKNKIKGEEFSGYSNQSILQDFYSTLFVSNIQTLIVSEINEELQEEQGFKKYQYKVNNSLSYGFMKDRILSLFLSQKEMAMIMEELKSLFKDHLVPIRPDRSYKRNVGKYRSRVKPIVTKNHKNSL